MSELKAIQGVINGQQFELYFKSEADMVIAELKAKVNGLKNLANLWEYNAQNEHNESVMVNMEKIKLKNRADKLLSCLKCLVMRDLIKDCPEKESAIEIVKEYKNVLG